MATHFPAERAYRCLDCDACFEVATACPACSSRAVFPIERWLSRRGPQTFTVPCPYPLGQHYCGRTLTVVLEPDRSPRGMEITDRYGCPIHARAIDVAPIWSAVEEEVRL